MCLCRKQSGCQVIPSEDKGRQWQFVFSQHAFQWKKRERLPACCLNLRQTVSVWVMGLPTAIVTAHLGGVMARFSIFPVCLSSFFPLCVKQLKAVDIHTKCPQLYLLHSTSNEGVLSFFAVMMRVLNYRYTIDG